MSEREPQTSVTKEIQEAFAAFCQPRLKNHQGELRVYPDSLLLVTRPSHSREQESAWESGIRLFGEVFRDYYKLEGEIENSNFRLHSGARFFDLPDGGFTAESIKSTQADGEKTIVRFNTRFITNTNGKREIVRQPYIEVAFQNQHIHAFYDTKGILSNVLLYQSTHASPQQNRLELNERKLAEINDKGLTFFESEDGFYEVSSVGPSYTIIRSIENQAEDEILISGTINTSWVISNLFNPATLEDPINAPPELDDLWRFANLADVVGVKWERY